MTTVRSVLKRPMLPVVDARPPNFDKIVAVLPDSALAGVMFAYGDKVYFPGFKGVCLSRELDAHERVHIERQNHIEGGPDKWWELYLTDIDFRFNEELLAHRAEYQCFCKRHIDQRKRVMFLDTLAKRLSSPLYGVDISPMRAAIDIRFGDAK